MGRSNELIAVYSGFATMLEAGIPLLRVFEFLKETHKGAMRRILTKMLASVNDGRTVSEAMADHPRVFADFDRTLVAASEESGDLDLCFNMLTEWYEFTRKLKRTVVSGLMLPMAVLHIAAAVLPMPGLVLGQHGLGAFLLQAFGILAFFYLPAIAILVVILLGPRLAPLRTLLDGLVLWVPVLGKGVRELCIARFSRAFGMMFKAGIPMSECFAAAPQVVGNRRVAEMFAGGAECVARGEMPSGGFSRRIPAAYRELWQVGEETGKLDACADKIAEISSDQAELLLDEFARWLPRLVYGLVALFMIQSILGLAGQVVGNYGVPQ